MNAQTLTINQSSFQQKTDSSFTSHRSKGIPRRARDDIRVFKNMCCITQRNDMTCPEYAEGSRSLRISGQALPLRQQLIYNTKMTTSPSLPAYSNLSFVSDVWRWIRPYRGRFGLAVVLRAMRDILSLFPDYALAMIVTILSRGDFAGVWGWVAVLGLVHLARAITQVVHRIPGYQVAERSSLDAQSAAVAHMTRLDAAWHEKENAGNKLKRIQKGREGIQQSQRIFLTSIIEIVVTFIGISVVLANLDRMMLLILLTFIVTNLALSALLTARISRAEIAVNESEENATGLVFEILNNVRTVRALGLGQSLLRLYTQRIDAWFASLKNRIRKYQSRSLLLNIWGQGFRFAALAFGVWQVIHGAYAVGFLVLFYGYFGRIWELVNELSEVLQDLTTNKYAVARLMSILAEPVNIDDDSGKTVFDPNWQKLEIASVTFGYGERDAITDVHLTVRRGERIGIVGLSGAGKSTLFKLLLKEHENYSGEILFDATPLRKIQRQSYARRVAAVLQDTEVFNFSLKDNITLGESADEKRLEQALRVAHVKDFLHKLKNGVDTLIGEKGVKLSGGERQRLGIARAVYRQPDLLLLDEATSHLDVVSEEKIQDSLAHVFTKVTAIVIAHRLTTIQAMDRIVVLEGGRILEQGSFAELMGKQGRFYELWERQKF